MVSDGMSMGTLTAADHFSQLLRGRGLTWLHLYQQPGVASAWMNMRSLNSIVTDSSAASSSWGCGSRIVNGAINVFPDGRELLPLYTVLGQAGWKRGLVTTTEITHATPAGFAASGLNRDAGDVIADQYFARKIDLLLGGGKKFFNPKERKDKRDLLAEFQQAGYVVMDTLTELQQAPLDKPWLGTFSSSHLPFTLDHISDAKLIGKVPTLATLTRYALKKLERESHFILQVEGGRVDHACHSCDAAAALHDQIAFDEAIDVCLEFQRRMPETLVVITTDHGNGNPGINGTGDKYAESPTRFRNLQQIRHSFGEILKKMEKVTSEKEVKRIVKETTGYNVPSEKAAMLLPFLEKKGKAVYDLMNSKEAQLGQLLGNYCGIGWAGGAHTGDYVPLLACGPGAERFRGFIQNTQVFHNYLALAKVDFRNPELPLLAECGPSAAEAEGAEAYV
jgi:alkaline phosphatase